MADGTQLVRYEAACRAVAEAKATDEILRINDEFAQRQAAAILAKNRQMETDAAEIRIRAQRRLGELIRAQKETVGLATGGEHGGKAKIDGTRSEPSNARPTLAEAGIDKKLSSHAQKLAALPTEEFEDRVTEWRARSEYGTDRVSTNVLREPKAPTPPANVVAISQPRAVPNEHIDECMATIRRLLLKALDDLEPAEWPALFAELRYEIADLKKVANKRQKNGHHAARQSA